MTTQILSRNLKYKTDGDGKIVDTDVEDSLCRMGFFTHIQYTKMLFY